jgi:hypothetical protein
MPMAFIYMEKKDILVNVVRARSQTLMKLLMFSTTCQ